MGAGQVVAIPLYFNLMDMTVTYLGPDEVDQLLQVEEDWKKVFVVAEMQDTFEDLQVAKTDTGQLLYCTAEANKEAEAFEIDTTNGHVRVWTYISLDKHDRVHTSPPCFTIGAVNPAGFGVIPRYEWNVAMEEAGLQLSLIRKVKSYLDSRAPVCYL